MKVSLTYVKEWYQFGRRPPLSGNAHTHVNFRFSMQNERRQGVLILLRFFYM